MSRAERFTRDEILDGALAAVAEHGRAATIAQVALASTAPVGSIYHRFSSRDEMLASLWIREVNRFHVSLRAVVDAADPRGSLLRIAVHSVQYARNHPDRTAALTLFRQQDLVRSGPEALRDDVRGINDEVTGELTQLIRAVGCETETQQEMALTAVVQLPYALVRPYVGGDVPAWLDDAAQAAAAAILSLATSS